MRRATGVAHLRIAHKTISIHALREEGDDQKERKRLMRASISIHALREEGDRFCRFLLCVVNISIHALREEGDCIPLWYNIIVRYFNPRPP